MKHFLYFLALIFLAFTSCNQGREESVGLRIGVMSSMDYLPIAIAHEQGIFDKYQVKVDIQKFYSANDRDAAFQTGNIDGTVIDYTGAIIQKAGGVDLKITSACNSTFCLMTGSQSGIQQIADLKSKQVAVSRNTVIDFCVEMALQSAQLSPADIEKQEINKIPIRLEMMMKGQSDATALPDPFISIAIDKGAQSIVCMEDLGYVVTGIMFKTEIINSKSSEIEAFYQAYNEAVQYIHAHSIEDIQTILVKEIGFPEVLVHSVKLPTYTLAQIPQNKDIQVVTDWLKGKGLIPVDFSTDDILESRFTK